MRDEGEEAFAQSKQHDYFECEGPGLGSMLRKVAQRSSYRRPAGHGVIKSELGATLEQPVSVARVQGSLHATFGDTVLPSTQFGLLKAFQAAAEEALAQERPRTYSGAPPWYSRQTSALDGHSPIVAASRSASWLRTFKGKLQPRARSS